MNHASHPAAKSSCIARTLRRWAIVIFLLLVSPALLAQTSQSGSLADIARQVRAQKQGQANANSNQAQQVADELSEDQNDGGAPGGFKTYNAGDYKLWVPAPYKVEGHDDAGIVLSGPMVGVKHALVLVGTPIAVHGQNNDATFQDAATHFSRMYARSANCQKATIADHAAYRCGLAAANLLGNHVSGNAVFVLDSGNIYPLVCVTPTDGQSHDTPNDSHVSNGAKSLAQKTLDPEDADSRKIRQQCDTVFQSILLRPQVVQRPSAPTNGPATAPGTAARAGLEQPGKSASANGAAPGKSPAAADTALGTSQGQAQVTPTPPSSGERTQASTVPPGYKVHPFHYCSGPQQCWDASVLVPADAQLISSDCNQHVFETKVQATAFLLMAGPARGDCDGRGASPANLVRWKQLADPESARAPGTYSTISSQMTKLAGKLATITTMEFRTGLTEWMGKRVEVESNGVPLVVGCIAPRDHFDDGDAVCSTLIGSLQLP
jgi:hypothetical protein